MNKNSLLLIEDDLDLCQLLEQLLVMEGYSVTTAHDGITGLALAQQEQHQLILLDVMLPQLNGFEVLKRLRHTSLIPVLMLTAKGDEIDRVIGLEFGADDYLPKPFNDRELLARIKAILRRTQDTQPKPQLALGDIVLHHGRQEAKCKDQIIDLTGTEYLLLVELINNVGELLDKNELNQKVLGKRLQAFDRSLDMHISNLRKKLPPRDDSLPRIKTVRGHGYIWLEG
ncbi:response regulator [Psychrobium sp. 1_MG-2023]|uniref:response regulator n=1 Tax=Psychrobium sp. 1_MG-2023 TaxID=3062624 RepID=UPI000C330F16|nr:response regulator [Psychrobium sp. 1_MG-2023]MDP2561047.1 response regulator [Psychrobium sp. 1_MG-2023]PKF58339.1 DNA-binding response regulator [Alteromonadales bacterium alter-6D02]